MITKKKLRKWYEECLHAYQQGWREVIQMHGPYNVQRGESAELALKRGRGDAHSACQQQKIYREPPTELPLDLWQEVLAIKLRAIADPWVR